jgi:crotonobetainyl-CoA:carnitine CoA-transferase CaiB-like acyl-CoA transferase
MSGIYEYMRPPDQPPRANPVGALGDISSALFGAVGVLAALRHRDRTGAGQHVDVAMYDAAVAMTDIVVNFASLGQERNPFPQPYILDAFRASDGWFVVQLVRPHQFAPFAETVGHPEWADDPRLAAPPGWGEHLEDVIRPGVEAWAADKTKADAVALLMSAGVAAGPCHDAAEVIADPHLRKRRMIVELERTDGVDQPVLLPGNPVKLSAVPEPPDGRVPWLGEHTDEVLRAELGLDDDELAALAAADVIRRSDPGQV